MLGYYGMFLVVWLTHPGVVLNLFKTNPVLSAFWQVLWVYLLFFTITKKSMAITMSIVYTVFSAVWVYAAVRRALVSPLSGR